MSDRYSGVVVVFKKPIRDDDAQLVVDAIRLLGCVHSAHAVERVDTVTADTMADMRADIDARTRVYEALFPTKQPTISENTNAK